MNVKDLRKMNPQKYKGLSYFALGIIVAFMGVALLAMSFEFGRYIVYGGFCIVIVGIFVYFRVTKK